MSTNPGIQRPDPTNRTRTVAVRRPQDLTTTPPATTPRGRGVTKAATTDLTPTQGRRGVLDRLRRRDLAPGADLPAEVSTPVAARGWPRWAAVAVLLLALAAYLPPALWLQCAFGIAVIPFLHGVFLYVVVLPGRSATREHGRKAGSLFWRFYGKWFWKVAAFFAAGAALSYLMRAGLAAVFG